MISDCTRAEHPIDYTRMISEMNHKIMLNYNTEIATAGIVLREHTYFVVVNYCAP